MVFNQYPGDHSQYPKGTPSQYMFPKIDFQSYSQSQTIIQSSAKDYQKDLICTSGVLTCNILEAVKKAWTTTHNFRMLCNPKSDDKAVGYTDCAMMFLGGVHKWHPSAPSWSGLHIFSRYQTSDDLYVASWRKDGKAVIKKKVNGTYTTLKQITIGAPQLGEEYEFEFIVEGSDMTYKINGATILETMDSDLAWGTCGVRLDYGDMSVDYIRISDV